MGTQRNDDVPCRRFLTFVEGEITDANSGREWDTLGWERGSGCKPSNWDDIQPRHTVAVDNCPGNPLAARTSIDIET